MSKDEIKDGHDIILIHGMTEDGEGMNAVRSRPNRLDFTELRPAKEGQDGSELELVRLRPREQAPFICDVDVLHTPLAKPEPKPEQELTGDHAGPPRITSKAYRKNWDLVFGLSKSKVLKNSILN